MIHMFVQNVSTPSYTCHHIQQSYLLQSDHQHLPKQKRSLRGTKKLGYPVAIHVYELAKFADFAVSL